MTLQPNFSNTSPQEHSLSFAQHFSYPMPLLRTTPLVQLVLHIHFLAFIPSPLLLSILLSTPHTQYPSFILCTTTLSHPPSAATWDPRYFKQSTSSNVSLFSIVCIRSPLPYLEHLITSLLPIELSTFFFRILCQTHSPVYTTSPPSQPLVRYHLQITAGLS